MLYVIGFAIRWSLIFFALKAFLGLDSLPDFNSQHFLGTANGLILQLSFVASATYEVIRMAFRLRARPRNTTMERSEEDDEKNGNTYIHLHAGTMNDVVYRHHLFNDPDLGKPLDDKL